LIMSITSEYKYFNWNKQTNRKMSKSLKYFVDCVLCAWEWISFHLKMKDQIPSLWTVLNSICYH
jgi:hypothetical protein